MHGFGAVDAEAVYYGQWLDRFEEQLTAAVLSEAEIERRTSEFFAGERDASEFVEDDVDH